MPASTTAIARSKPSAPIRHLHQAGLLVGRCLDYGCGRGMDADTYGMEGYDPTWRPREPSGRFDTITCTYVLNVVDEAAQEAILAAVRGLLAPGGAAYISVRRDLPREGMQGRGCWQRYVTLDAPTLSAGKGRWATYWLT